MTPWCDDLVCSWRRLLADRHSLPFPWTLSLHRRWCPLASHHPLTFLFLLALTFPLPSPFPSLGLSLCRPRKQPIWAAGDNPHLMLVEQGLPWHPVAPPPPVLSGQVRGLRWHNRPREREGKECREADGHCGGRGRQGPPNPYPTPTPATRPGAPRPPPTRPSVPLHRRFTQQERPPSKRLSDPTGGSATLGGSDTQWASSGAPEVSCGTVSARRGLRTWRANPGAPAAQHHCSPTPRGSSTQWATTGAPEAPCGKEWWARKGKEPSTKPGWAKPRTTARPPCSVNHPGHQAGAHHPRQP